MKKSESEKQLFRKIWEGLSHRMPCFKAVLLMLVMIIPAVHVSAAGSGEIEGTSGTVMIDSEALLDNNELLEAYVEQLFAAEETDTDATTAQSAGQSVLSRICYIEKAMLGGDCGLLADYGSEYLTDINLEIYQELKSAVALIASGEQTSSVVTMSFTYTFSELGVSNVYDAAAAFQDQLDFTAIITYLTNDCPYELYWFDKTASSHWTVSYTYSSTKLYPTLTFTFAVAEGYQGDSTTTVDASKVAVAVQAAENAKTIVEEYAGLTDAEKLAAYRDEICGLVSYCEDSTVSYGDVWQLVYVFDGDSTTNVVCEGYSKAFQYLCDLSSFDYVSCLIVDGYMTSSSSYGAHMWNIVCLEGVNYLVDVTNSDSGTIGVNGGLFLVCADDAASSSSSGYSFKVNGTTITYSYSSTILSLYTSDDLTLGSAANPTLQILTQPQDITAYDGDSVYFTISAVGNDVSYQWQYSTNSGTTWVNGVGTSASYKVDVYERKNGYLYRCIVTDANGNSIISDVAELIVNANTMEITTQPQDITASDGDTVYFTIAVTGTDVTYQWQYSTNGGTTWVNSVGTSASYRVDVYTRKNGYLYRCIVTDANGNTLTSDVAELIVSTLTITTQPQDITASDGDTVYFTIAVTGTDVTYQWQYSTNGGTTWVNSVGTSASYRVDVYTRKNGYLYRCIVTDANGNTLTSDVAELIVSTLTITTQPQDITASDGDTVYFTIAVTGTDVTYQWQYSTNGGTTWVNSVGTSASYRVDVYTRKNGYLYRCIVTDANGNTLTSDVAELIVSMLTITTQPQDITASDGDTVYFTIAVTGTDVTYQWQYSTNGGTTWVN
ncbi:MAG: hypothetical protein LUE29_11655, partial [Lachnospiraceae bacterium]|nr:hypothetical protein [Lachnospiraceae bacterium]